MSARELWNEWTEPFDLFISYSRADNATGMVTALVEAIEADFARFSPSLPLKVFFDKKSILDMQHWQEVLKKGLRQSKVMLAVLSPAYFHSDWCRREWEEYLLVEQSRTYPGEALTPLFIVAPAELSRAVPDAARDWWDDVTARNAVVEIHPFWPNGRAALQEQIVVERLRQLQYNVRARIEHGRTLARVPRDIRGRNPNFVGRKRELAQLRDALSRFEMVGLCAVNGVGGIGKSSLAREYAYVFRRDYLGGQFEIDLSTTHSVSGVQDQLVRLARDYLGADIAPTLPEAEQHARARAAFQQLPPGQTALLILDNLHEEDARMLGRGQREAGLPTAEKVHLLVTTRADPRALGGMETVALDILPPADALDLLARYRAFGRNPEDGEYLRARADGYRLTEPYSAEGDEEWKAALAIVNRLGRHTLAVTLVGAYLGSYPDLTYEQFAANLATHGIGLALDAVGNDEMVKSLIQHPETLIGPLFERSVARLSGLALRTLEYAALLPADLLPMAWLKELVSRDDEMTAALTARPFQPPPWEETLRSLTGMQYLVGQPYARMHRVVQEVVRRRLSEEELARREREVVVFVESRTDGTYADARDVASTEQFVRERAEQGEPLIGQTAMWLVSCHEELGQLRSAVYMARLANRILKQVADADPASAEKQRDLSISFNKLGGVSEAAGDLAAARDYYEQGLAISRRLADADPASAEKQRDLSISFNKLGGVSEAAGDLAAARDYYEQCLVIRRRLADADPASAQKQRDLGISFNKLGGVSEAAGDLAAARDYYEQGLAISRRLADADPASAQKQRDLSVSFEMLGNVSEAAGDLAAARDYYEQCLVIRRRLADADPASAQKQRDLSISFNKLGGVSEAAGDLAVARDYYEQGLVISRRLADADPASAEKQRDLSISFNKLGGVSEAAGDLAAARDYYEQDLEISRRLADADPASAQKQRDLGISHYKLFSIENKLGNRAAAHDQLAAFVAVWGRLEEEGRLPRPSDRASLQRLRQQLDAWDG